MWDEFYLTASHLQDKTTTHLLQGITPYEKWYEQKPDYSYMREIGCCAFILIQPIKKNPKILECSLKCVSLAMIRIPKCTTVTIKKLTEL